MSYSLKLKDPRWQKKRLEILDRDQFTCTKCGDDETELHVHHHYYVYNKELWDYDDNALSTLCTSCHRIETERINIVKEYLRGYRYDRLKHLSHIIVCGSCFNELELKEITKKCTEILDRKGIEWEYINENDK